MILRCRTLTGFRGLAAASKNQRVSSSALGTCSTLAAGEATAFPGTCNNRDTTTSFSSPLVNLEFPLVKEGKKNRSSAVLEALTSSLRQASVSSDLDGSEASSVPSSASGEPHQLNNNENNTTSLLDSAQVSTSRGASLNSASIFSASSAEEAMTSLSDASSQADTDTSDSASAPPLPSPSPENISQLVEKVRTAAAWNHGQPGKRDDESLWNPELCRDVVARYTACLEELSNGTSEISKADQRLLLSSETVTLAFKALIKCQYDPDQLAVEVRNWERCVGSLKRTPLTDHLSLRLLEANAKAGNVGRVMRLLQLRKSRHYRPRSREFVHAITSLNAANWRLRRNRNVFVSDADTVSTDNPTRWLDAILIHMQQRGFPLTVPLANRMLEAYANGPTGKAVHHFYRVARHPVADLPPQERPTHVSNMPQEWAHAQGQYTYQPICVRLNYHAAAPPFYKIPAQVKGKMLFTDTDRTMGQTKLEKESDPEWSLPLAAAFSFADSLLHGACGHDPIELNVRSYNALIKVSVVRGSLWRALHVLNEVMPSQNNIGPSIVSYNHILVGLARVGDVSTQQEYYRKLLNAGLEPNAFTVRAIVDGLLNLGDLSGAVTVVQDFFNQHSVLPPYTTHVKILEFCLGRDMVYEAKRYVYFIQQLWLWEPNEYHSERFVKLMRATQRNTQLQKPALQQLFAYFGEVLDEQDFL